MYFLEPLDVLSFIKCLKLPEPSFPVLDFVSFSNGDTRSSSFENSNTTLALQAFLNMLISLKLYAFTCRMPSLPLTFLFCSQKLNPILQSFFGPPSLPTLIHHFQALFTLFVLVTNVVQFL